MSTPHLTYTRPTPPPALRRPGIGFGRAEDVEQLVRVDFVARGGLFFDVEHFHLSQARVGVLWAASAHVDRGSAKAGMAQLVKTGEPKKWGEALQRALLMQFFARDEWPTFLVYLSGPVWTTYSDREAFALVDHELLHCAVARDPFGAPRFNDRTGKPVWSMRPHDHEGFVGTTERWGAAASGAAGIVAAGVKAPRFAWVPGRDLDVARACAGR